MSCNSFNKNQIFVDLKDTNVIFFVLFLFIHLVTHKGLRKNSEIFVNLRRSSGSLCVSTLTADHYFWCSRVFLAVLSVFRGIVGCSGVFWGIMGCSRGVPGLFQAVPGCSGFYRHPPIMQSVPD